MQRYRNRAMPFPHHPRGGQSAASIEGRGMTFYDDWLQAGAEIREAFRRSPVIARDADIPWESTRQDHRVKLMISNDRGFC